MKEQVLVDELESNRARKCKHYERVCPKAAAPEIDEEREHEERRQLEPTQLGNRLKQPVQRFLPDAVRRFGDLVVERREGSRGDRDRHRDERDRQHDDRDETRE